MFGLGTTELVCILIIVLVLFGASRIPALGRGIGLGIRDLKKGLSDSSTESKDPDHF